MKLSDIYAMMETSPHTNPKHSSGKRTRTAPRDRFTIKGLTHKNGAPIRFKSRAAAVAHVTNVWRNQLEIV